MKKVLLVALATIGLAACSSSRPDAVENPYTSGNNTHCLSVTRVEANDSATVINLHCNYRPGQWIRIASGSQIEADGQRYELIGAEGIVPDSMLVMPESGQADLSLIFKPVPADVEAITFMEGEGPDDWHIWGIDLTGKRSFADVPAGLPAALAKSPSATDPMPAYIMKADSSTVNVQMLEYQPSMGSQVELRGNTPVGDRNEIIKLDSQGRGSAKFPVHGTTEYTFLLNGSNGVGTTWIAPGETVNVYLRPDNVYPEGFEATPTIYSDGVYGQLTAANSAATSLTMPELELDITTDDGEAVSRKLADWYKAVADSVAAADVPEMVRQYALADAQNTMLFNAENPMRTMIYDYWNKTGEWGVLPGQIPFSGFSEEQKARILGSFELNPQALLMVNGGSFPSGTPDNTLVREFNIYGNLARKASALQLTDADRETLRALSSPFYLESLEMLEAETRAIMESEAADMVQTAPDVPADKLFSAIVEPYRGKVVIVDFWNTWCGPCRSAIKQNEPLKSGELASDDIVWIYLASESSPLPKYLQMIPDIKGVHYRLTQEQIAPIYDQFQVDGIPFYVMVDRDGKVTSRPDFRDHDLMVSTIKEAL